MDAKALAAQIRKDIRVATRTAGDPLEGLTISVRVERASLMQAIEVTVQDIDRDAMFTQPDEGARQWTDRARDITDRLHELAADGMDWDNGRHRFCTIAFAGPGVRVHGPAPREQWEKTGLAGCGCPNHILDEEGHQEGCAERAANEGARRGHLVAVK